MKKWLLLSLLILVIEGAQASTDPVKPHYTKIGKRMGGSFYDDFGYFKTALEDYSNAVKNHGNIPYTLTVLELSISNLQDNWDESYEFGRMIYPAGLPNLYYVSCISGCAHEYYECYTGASCDGCYEPCVITYQQCITKCGFH